MTLMEEEIQGTVPLQEAVKTGQEETALTGLMTEEMTVVDPMEAEMTGTAPEEEVHLHKTEDQATMMMSSHPDLPTTEDLPLPTDQKTDRKMEDQDPLSPR